MEDLGEYSLPVIEFKGNNYVKQTGIFIENGSNTLGQCSRVDAWAQSTHLCSRATQTEYPKLLKYLTEEYEHQLAVWLHKITPCMEKELLKGLTPIPNEILPDARQKAAYTDDYTNFRLFQKIVIEAVDNSLVIATWLAVHTNNAPALVASTIAPHDGWCEHMGQTLKLFIPRRIPGSDAVTYKEMKSVPIKACLRSLCTNYFNKNIFAGSTFNDEIYVWQFEPNLSDVNSFNIKELFNTNCSYGFAVAMDWPNETTLLTAHNNGYIIQWQLAANISNISKIPEFVAKLPFEQTKEICTLLSLNVKDFIVGTKQGDVYHCWIWSIASTNYQIKATPLEKHSFAISTLLKSHCDGNIVIISCDISGEVHYHDLRNQNEDVSDDFLVLQIPLPFQNKIACSTDGSLIYYCDNGCLQCYGLFNDYRSCINSTVKGKSNFIKRSDNGCWIVTGLHDDNHIQIFAMDV